jgi:fructan beta-fructosidase
MPSEPYRPQFHFTPADGWINDPNGLVYFRSEWHLFYQYFQAGMTGGMRWGHAVSDDLMHWAHLPVAISPDRFGDIWSGSAVVDHHDTSGLFGGKPGIVCLFTYWDPSDGRQSQGLAFSGDGRSFRFHDGNPVIPKLRDVPGQPDDNDFRDPKVFWHAATGRWVMAVAGGKLRIFSSANLIDWRFESIADEINTECPDLFPLPIDGDESRIAWVLSGGGRWYQIGDFDGGRFHPTSLRITMNSGPDFYATQTWSDSPDGRIAISWLHAWNYESNISNSKIRNAFPTSPWSGGSLTFADVLTLRTTAEGVRLFQTPIPRLQLLGEPLLLLANLILRPRDANPLAAIGGKAFDVQLVFRPAGRLALRLPASAPEYAIIYDAEPGMLSIDRTNARAQAPASFRQRYDAPMAARKDGTISLRLLIDHSSVEIYINDGAATMSAFILPDPNEKGVIIESELAEIEIIELRVDRVRSTIKQ